MVNEENKKTRREFIQSSLRLMAGLGLGAIIGGVAHKTFAGDFVWQIDMNKCTQCGRCADECVLSPSAVKCVHVYDMCGYCDLCGGYLRPGAKQQDTAAENQLCPTAAIERRFIEEPFFEYHVIDDLCIGCGKCVKGCGAFGNGSMQLQVKHDFCVNCNQCAIALKCPADAFKRVPANNPYLLRGFTKKAAGSH